jgi:hypothetical protein
VRNAVADKSQNGLKAIPGTKNPIKIEYDEAVRWLHLRRGFIPSPKRPSEDRFLANHIREIETSERFSGFITARLRNASASQANANGGLNWSTDKVTPWSNGTFRFDADLAGQLARVLDVDAPLFVGKALEVSLRRDACTLDRQE